MNREQIIEIANELETIADLLEIEHGDWCDDNALTDPSEKLREIAGQIRRIFGSLSKASFDGLQLIDDIRQHCEWLEALSKSLASTDYEIRLRRSVFDLLRGALVTIEAMIPTLPQNLCIHCQPTHSNKF